MQRRGGGIVPAAPPQGSAAMGLGNTATRWGSLARVLHWLTALLILTLIPLGLVANALPAGSEDEVARKVALFSLHKTAGIAALAVAVLRILWALGQPRPVPVHPGRQAEVWAAEAVHWTLYLSLVLVPVTGWVHHAATDGFAPILWPLGQGLPLVPKSETVAAAAGSAHWVFTKLLAAALILHVAGALKHALVDRDGTLARMVTGRPAGQPAGQPAPHRAGRAPLLAALALYGLGAGAAVALLPAAPPAAAPAPIAAPAPAPAPGAWVVAEGELAFVVRQMGAEVRGRFPDWQADIRFDPQSGTGSVAVTIATPSLSLGAVTGEALGEDFFAAATHPEARFEAAIRPAETPGNFVADGTLTLRGVAVPVALPFSLALDGDRAQAAGRVTLDRRAFGMGAAFPDDKTVGFEVGVDLALTATRAP
jgi:cytochrome b561/polyisoprenoid-binding protein YceI